MAPHHSAQVEIQVLLLSWDGIYSTNFSVLRYELLGLQAASLTRVQRGLNARLGGG